MWLGIQARVGSSPPPPTHPQLRGHRHFGKPGPDAKSIWGGGAGGSGVWTPEQTPLFIRTDPERLCLFSRLVSWLVCFGKIF